MTRTIALCLWLANEIRGVCVVAAFLMADHGHAYADTVRRIVEHLR